MVFTFELITFIIITLFVVSIFAKPLNAPINQEVENFAIWPTNRHAKLNDFGGVDYVDDKPPWARGEGSCVPRVCPAVYEKDVICWQCSSYIEEPQNNIYPYVNHPYR